MHFHVKNKKWTKVRELVDNIGRCILQPKNIGHALQYLLELFQGLVHSFHSSLKRS